MKKILLLIYLTIVGLAFGAWVTIGTLFVLFLIAFSYPEKTYSIDDIQTHYLFIAPILGIYFITAIGLFDAIKSARKLWMVESITMINKIIMVLAPIWFVLILVVLNIIKI